MVVSSKTTQYEGTGSGNANAPWVQHDYTYDDYNGSGITSGYHNRTKEVITSSNAPTVTRKWTYTPTDSGYGATGWIFYDVNKVTSSEVDDASGHVWQCEDTTYDEGAPAGAPSGTPGAGWPTTLKTYSNCTNKSATAITRYTGYDLYGNVVANVDGVATANASLYTSNGCTLSTAPAIMSSNWGKSRYTTCMTYDSYNTQVSGATNALGQHSSVSYDYTQGALPTTATDTNSQVTTTTDTYDASSSTNGKVTSSIKEPGENGTYTTQSNTYSSCTSSSSLPCFEVDSNASQYTNDVTRTYYDSMGREVETRTTGPSSLDTVAFTVYNPANNSTFESVSFEVQSSLNSGGWVDPNGAVDYQGVTPGGTVTFYDALGRTTGVQDPMYGSSQEPGISCIGLQGTWTGCSFYGLGTAHGDATTYFYAAVLDPNNHGSASFADALGRMLYTQRYSGTGLTPSTLNTNITMLKATQYNVLNKAISVTTTDVAPQSGQSITSVTTSATYDDIGRLITSTDPDMGNDTYTYDANGHIFTRVSGTRTFGYNYDLLGRVGCVQDAAPTINATGACTSGTHPFVQNTYDTSVLGTQGSTDFPVGELTQQVATTYFPDGTQATVTQQMQHDQRENLINEHMQLSLPGSWNVTSPLPTYQMALSYNDAGQLTTTTTSTNPTGQGYTTTQVYDTNSGVLTGLSNNGIPTANLATLTYNARALDNTVNFQTTTGSQLASEQFGYDANQRPTTSSATWQSGSGASGTIFSQSISYDNASNVIGASTTQAAVPGQNGSGGSEVQNFCYDEQNRLVWAGNSGTQPAAGNGTCGSGVLSSGITSASYSNSFVSTNLGQTWQSPLNGGSTQYQYLYCDSTHPHQLTGVYPAGTTCSNKSGQLYTSSYDSWGNVTSRFSSGTTATLSYDALDQLTQWSAGTNSEQYVYDALGERILLRSTSGSTTTMTVYAFGLEEHTYTGSGTNQSNIYYYYLGDRLLGESNGTSTSFFLTDTLGSVLSSFSNVAGSAAIQGNQLYGPYGNTRYSAGTMGTAKGFTGQYADTLSGLDYYNARYYDPVVGRFLSADTVEGNLQGMDPFAYVSSNPETSNDPTGHCGGWWDFGCEAQQAWNTGVTAWNTGAQAITSTWSNDISPGLQHSWSDFTSGHFGQSMQDLQQVTRTVIKLPVKIVIAVAALVLVAIGITAIVRVGSHKNSAWNNRQQRTAAYGLAVKAQNTRNSIKIPKKSDWGDGYIEVNGKGKNPLGYDTPPGTDLEGYGRAEGGHHTEDMVMKWAEATLRLLTANGQIRSGDIVHLLIFTQVHFCSGCRNKMQTWLNMLKAVVPPGVRIFIYVWEKTNPDQGDPNNPPVLSPNDVKPAPGGYGTIMS